MKKIIIFLSVIFIGGCATTLSPDFDGNARITVSPIPVYPSVYVGPGYYYNNFYPYGGYYNHRTIIRRPVRNFYRPHRAPIGPRRGFRGRR
jgi:hypothetical protein